MTDWIDSMTRSMALDRLRASRGDLLDLRRELVTARTQARSYTDDRLTGQGLAEKREELVAAARARLTPKLAALKAQVEQDSGIITRWAAAQRPKMAQDAASLMRAQMKWDQVRMRLEAGMSLREVLSRADRESVLAAAEWAPSWLEAQAAASRPSGIAGANWKPPESEWLARAADDRLAQLEGGMVAQAVQLGREVAGITAGFEPAARGFEGTLAGDERLDGLTGALEAHYAQQDALHGPAAPEGDGAQQVPA